MRRAFSFLILLIALAASAPPVHAAPERTLRFELARPGLRRQLKRGDFVRLEVEERKDGTRVVMRVY